MTRIFLLFIILLFTGCSVIDIKDFHIETNPSSYNQILAENEALIVKFNHNVKRGEAEKLISLTEFFSEDKVQADFVWTSGKDLRIEPVVPLKEGVRYLLTLSGNFELSDGGSFSRNITCPFYFRAVPSYCRLSAFTPDNNGILGVKGALTYTFDQPLNTQDFEDHFLLSPSVETEFLWNAENTEVTVTPLDMWTQYTVYTWDIPREAAENTPFHLLKNYKGTFLIQEDILPPELTQISGGTWESEVFTETSVGLNNISGASVLKLVFTEELNEDSFRGAFKVTPDIEGVLHREDPVTWLFIPSENWTQETRYHLSLSRELKDVSGNQMVSDINEYFSPVTPPVSIARILIDSELPDVVLLPGNFNTSTEYAVDPSPLTNGIFITIDFDGEGFISPDAKIRFLNSLSLEGYFPKVSGTQLVSVSWPSDTQVILIYEGLVRGGIFSWDKQTYKLLMKSGAQYQNDGGAWLKEDVYVYIRI